MSLESHLKDFPSGLSMSTANDTGIRSEKDFDDIENILEEISETNSRTLYLLSLS